MPTIQVVLMLVALVLLFLAALNISSSRINLGWLGLCLAFLSLLIGKV